jgi:BirA family biotin operon repressor/biotin-[acetyl-CoA-carboxylase] ligase
MSMILRPVANAAQTGQLALLAGAALANVLEPISPLSAKIKLKWPNDLLINGKKAAGILVETESHGLRQVPWIVVGIGVNIVSAPEGAISLHDIGVKDYDAGKILEQLAKEIQALFARWGEEGGFDDIRDAWMKRAYKRGEKITARLPKETVTGTFEGLDRTGALLLTLENGSRRIVSSGEVFTEE